MTDQLTDDDVARLYKERKYDEIAAAHADGRLAQMLGVPDDQIALLDKARTGVLTGTDARELNRLGRHDLVNAAREDGRIDYNTKD